MAVRSDDPDWRLLRRLSTQVYRKGFDLGVSIGKADHEIRALAAHPLGDHRYVVLAGDKMGSLYAAELQVTPDSFDSLPELGSNRFGWRRLAPIPGKHHRVIDEIVFVPRAEGTAVVVATRGGGAWIMQLDALLSSSPNEGFDGQQLPASEGKVVRELLFDPIAGALWAAADQSLLCWSLGTSEPVLSQEIGLDCRVTALAMDEGPDPQEDHLYLATSRRELQRGERNRNGFFAGARETVWEGRASVLEHLIPFSALRVQDSEGRWKRRYRERGIVGSALRHVLLLYEEAGADSITCVTRLVVATSKILTLGVLNLGNWQGLAVSALDGRVRLFRPSGMRNPGDEFEPIDLPTPESSSPASLLSGFEDFVELPDRVYAIAPLAPVVESFRDTDGQVLPVLLGLGNHQVHAIHFRVRWSLRDRAHDQAERMAAGSASLEELLGELQERALDAGDPEESLEEKCALLQMVPVVGSRCRDESSWNQLLLLIWDILARTEEASAIPALTILALRRLQRQRPDRLEELEDTIYQVRKYVLDRKSFSGKEMNFLELVRSTDPGLEDDRVIYLSILISRRADPIFLRDFSAKDEFGEVKAFFRLPWTPEGEPDPTWTTRPEDLRFLIATYRGRLWLMNGTGDARPAIEVPEEWGHVESWLIRQNRVLLSFSEGGLAVVEGRDLLAAWEPDTIVELEPFETHSSNPIFATALATVPDATEKTDSASFLWGERNGDLNLFAEEGAIPLVALAEDRPLESGRGAGSYEVTQLLSFELRDTDGDNRSMVVAATISGDIFLYEWHTEERDLTYRDHLRIGTQAVTTLRVAGAAQQHLVTGFQDGTVVGFRIVSRGDRPDEEAHWLCVSWTLRTRDTVRSIQCLDPQTSERLGEELLVVGSHDGHLRVLDLEGRPRETINLRCFQVGFFELAPRREEDGALTKFRLYTCAFKNRALGLRVMSRHRLIEQLHQRLDVGDENRELRLTRWRAYSVRDGHLRHRFLRHSVRFPGEGAAACIQALQQLLDVEDSSDRPTGEATALLRRLFQNRRPGDSTGTDRICGLREIFESPELYLGILDLLAQLEERWNTARSLEKRRVLLFWIRSFLRNVDGVGMLRRWIELGRDLEKEEPLASPPRLIAHFLNHTDDMLRVKTLHYLERQLLGWPGVGDDSGIAKDAERTDLEWLLEVLLDRLQPSPDVSRKEPEPVVLHVGRILALLVRGGQLDSLYLTYRLHRHGVPGDVYSLLADQLEALEIPGKPILPSDLLRSAHSLVKALERGNDLPEILCCLEELSHYCEEKPPGGPDSDYIEQAGIYFRSILALLKVQNFRELNELAARGIPPATTSDFYPSQARLAGIPDLLDCIVTYWRAKHDDLWTTPLEGLGFHDFDQLRRQWATLRETLEAQRPEVSAFEKQLLTQLVSLWQGLFDDEQNDVLLSDFSEIVERQCLQNLPEPIEHAQKAVEVLAQEERLLLLAFKNLFTRLTLFAEPDHAAFLYLPERQRKKIEYEIFPPEPFGSGAGDLQDATHTGDDLPGWLHDSWCEPVEFLRLDEEKVASWLRQSVAECRWEVKTIAGSAEHGGPFGFYIFGWKHNGDNARFKRFEERRLAWVLPLEALIFRQAALQQQDLKGRLFSIVAHNLGSPLYNIRSNLRLLVDGIFEDQPKERQEKYSELLHHARHMDGIIDAILDLRQRTVDVTLHEVSLAKVVYEVVRLSRKQASAKNIQISFPKPSQEVVEKTRFHTDENRIYDITNQLLDNAIKYSPAGKEIHVEVIVSSLGAAICVRDQGPGIPKEEIPLIFEPFFRGVRALDMPGLGLGLHVVQLYTQHLGGRVQVKSEKDLETTFFVSLPHRSADDSEGSE